MPKDLPSSKKLVKIGEAAEVLGVSIDTLRRWEKSNKLESIRTPGGTRLYPLEDLEKIANKNQQTPAEQKTNYPTTNILLDSHLPSSLDQSKTILDNLSNLGDQTKTPPSNEQHSDPYQWYLDNYGAKNGVDFDSGQTEESKKDKIYAKIYANLGSNGKKLRFVNSLALVLILLCLISIGSLSLLYLTRPGLLSSFFNEPRPKNGLHFLAQGILSPFDQAAKLTIKTFFPDQALSLGFSTPIGNLDQSKLAEVLAASSIAEDNKYLQINADTQITNNLAVEGQGIFTENLTAPNIIYGLVAGTNITVGPGQRPTISAAVNETLATVTARGAITSTPLTLNGILTLGSVTNLGRLSSDPSTGTNGQTYYNTTSNQFRCYQNGSWKNCDTTGGGGSGTVTSVATGNGLTGGTITESGTISVNLTAAGTAATATTSSGSGLEAASSGLTLLRGCSNSQVLQWVSGTGTWDCVSMAGGGTMSSFLLAGDSGVTQTITDGNTVSVAGGTNGIDTVAGATDTVTLNLDTTEISDATFGSGAGFTWTFNAGATDPTLAFASNQVTLGGSATLVLSGTTTLTSSSLATFTTAAALSMASTTTLTLGNGVSITNGSGNITLQPAGAATIANVQIGAGGAGSTTPDYLGLDVKSDTGDPAGGFEGAMYYNTFDNVFRCFQSAAWTNCITAAGAGTVTSSGTPLANRIAYFTTDTNITGDASLTFNPAATTGNTFSLSNTSLTSGTLLNLSATSTPTGGGTVNINSISLIDAASTSAPTTTGINYSFANNGAVAHTQNAMSISNAVAGSFTDTTTEALLLLDQADTTGTGTTALTDALRITNSGGSTLTNGITIGSGSQAITNGLVMGSTGITTDITLQNGETIQNDTDGTIVLNPTILTLSGSTTLTSSSLATFTTAASLSMASTTTLTLGNGVSITNGSGNITLQPAGSGTTANIQLGVGGAGSTTPDILGLDVKSDTGDPTGFEGAMYYNTFDNVFRCFQSAAWTNCITAAGSGITGSGTSGQVAFFNGASSITSEAAGFGWNTSTKLLSLTGSTGTSFSIASGVAPTASMATITNAGFATTSGISGLGITLAATTDTLADTVNGISLALTPAGDGSGTDTFNGINITTTGTATSDYFGLNIGSITNGAASEIAINVATGWDTVLSGTSAATGTNTVSITNTAAATVPVFALTANSTQTGSVLDVSGTSLTTGTGVNITGGGATALTTGSVLRVTGPSGAAAIDTNGVVNLVAAGAYTSVTNGGLLNLVANSTAAGVIQNIQGNALTTGQALRIASTGTGLTSGSLLSVSSATTGAVATNGIVSLTATGAYTSTANAGLLTLNANSTATGTIQSIFGNGLTTGTALNISTNSNVLTGAAATGTGSLLNILRTGTTLTAGTNSFTGSLVNIGYNPTFTVNGGTNIDTGNILTITRNVTATGAGVGYSRRGAVVSIEENCTGSGGGTCFSNANNAVLLLTESDANANGNVLKINNVSSNNAFLIINGSAAGGTAVQVGDLASTRYPTGSTVSLVNLYNNFNGSGATAYGYYMDSTDTTANANTDYGSYITFALTGNANKVAKTYYSTISSSSTTGESAANGGGIVNYEAVQSLTGALSATTRNASGFRSLPASTANSTGGTLNLYGNYNAPSSTGAGATSGTPTTNVFGVYAASTATHGGDRGTVNNYGVYIANGVSSTDGTATKYGLFIEDQATASLADTNYAIFSNGGQVAFALPGTQTGNAVCHTSTGTTTTADNIVDCDGTLSDYAERYPVQNGIDYGEIVAASDNFITDRSGTKVPEMIRSNSAYQNIIGVTSNNYSDFSSIGNNYDSAINTKPVALVGRVPVKVNLENGEIKKGDFITTSDTAGQGMKATRAGPVIGTALADYSGGGNGTVLVFVKATYADPGNLLANLSLDPEGTLIIPKLKVGSLTIDPTLIANLEQQNGQLSQQILNQQTSFTDRVQALTDTQTNQENRVASLESTAVVLGEQISSTSTQLADLSTQQESTSTALDSLKAQLENLGNQQPPADLTPAETLFATGSAQLADLDVTHQLSTLDLKAIDATVSATFKSLGDTFLGNTVVAGDFSQDGTLSISNGSTINALPTLYLQNSPLAQSVDLFGGLVTIDKSGTLKAQTITTNQIKIAKDKSAGVGILAAGTTKVTISNTFTQDNSLILITPQTITTQNLAVTAKISGQDFTVSIAQPQADDIKFSYLIIAQDD